MGESPSLRTRLQVLLALFAVVFVSLVLFQYFLARHFFFQSLENELKGDVAYLSDRIVQNPELLDSPRADSLCKALSVYKKFRFTLVDGQGHVIGDSHVPREGLATMENHLHRPEFAMAAERGWGQDHRRSATVGMKMIYVAHRLPDGHFLRVAAGPASLAGFQRIAILITFLFLLVFLAVTAWVVYWVGSRISRPLLLLQAHQSDISRPLRWDAPFREAEVLNQAFDTYVGEIRRLLSDLAKEHQRLIEVLNLLEEGVLLLGPTGELRTLNTSAVRLLSRTLNGNGPVATQSWIGQYLSDLSPVPELAAFVGAVARGERPPVLLIDKSEGFPRDLLCHLRALSGEGGELLLTLVDVSEFRQLDRMKSEFVANASHELKTPLASIRGYAEALIDGAIEVEKARKPFVQKILHNSLRLESLIGDLLSLSRLESEKSPRNSEPLPLRRYLNQAAALHRGGLDSAGIRFENHIPEDVTLFVEPRDLELIVNNLVSNAIKYNRPGGKVKALWETTDKGGRLIIKDTGVGIPHEMLPRIFERFYRADASRARQEGTGLGLAIVKHAAQRYQFAVKAESIPGDGSRFIIEVPAKSLRNAF